MPPLAFAARQQKVSTNGIKMQVYEDGPEKGTPIVFCHGFPELAYSWRLQLASLGAQGYRTIAPDLRGYGETDRTSAVEDYRVANLVGDIRGMLDRLAIEKAVFVGHDMGGLLTYAIRAMLPHRCHGVVSLNTPLRPQPPINPIEFLCRYRGSERYNVAFQKMASPHNPSGYGVAETILSEDVHKTFSSLMRTTTRSYEELMVVHPQALATLPIGIFVGEPSLGDIDILDAQELAVYVDTFTRTGFTGGLNWYRNIVRNWEDAQAAASLGSGAQAVSAQVPVLMVRATLDPVIRPEMSAPMPGLIPRLKMVDLECGHWTQQEKPQEVSDLIHEWIHSGYATP